MIRTYKYKPVQFFALTMILTWVSWFIAAYFSYQENGESIFIVVMLPGLVAPFLIALWMTLTSGSTELKQDFASRLFNLRLIRPVSFIPMLLLMPAMVLISILISLLFGQSADQLRFAEGFSFSAGMIPVLLILILAASFEELGWRSYAIDSLNAKFNYFTATLIFAALWGLWHLPLFFVNGYYQNEIIKENFIFGLNFMISTIPMAFIIGWLCRLNRGSIVVAILFHFFINLCQEALQMTQTTKCIETVVLLFIAAGLVMLNRDMFFEKKADLSI